MTAAQAQAAAARAWEGAESCATVEAEARLQHAAATDALSVAEAEAAAAEREAAKAAKKEAQEQRQGREALEEGDEQQTQSKDLQDMLRPHPPPHHERKMALPCGPFMWAEEEQETSDEVEEKEEEDEQEVIGGDPQVVSGCRGRSSWRVENGKKNSKMKNKTS